MREQGISESEIHRHVAEIGSRVKEKTPSPTPERIKKVLSSEHSRKTAEVTAPNGTTAELKAVDTALELLVKYGHETSEEKVSPVQTPEGGLLLPPIKLKRIFPGCYPVMEEVILSR